MPDIINDKYPYFKTLYMIKFGFFKIAKDPCFDCDHAYLCKLEDKNNYCSLEKAYSAFLKLINLVKVNKNDFIYSTPKNFDAKIKKLLLNEISADVSADRKSFLIELFDLFVDDNKSGITYDSIKF
jgi:hypothetical protein